MKKIKYLLLIIFLIPSIAFGAIPVIWTATSTDIGQIKPNAINGNVPYLNIPGLISTASSTIGADLHLTSPIGTSTITNALQFGGTARDNLTYFNASGRIFPASISTGGAVNIDEGTQAQFPALVLHNNSSGAGTGRLFVINQEGTAVTQDMMLASSSCTNCTALNIKGFPTGKGLLKVEHTGSGTGFSNSSGVSIDLLNATDAQGIFIKGSIGGTGNLLNIVDSSSGALASISSSGRVTSIYASTTAYASFLNASTTNLIVNGSSFNNLLGSGLALSSGALTVSNVPLTSLAGLPINSIVTTNSSGQLIATGTQLTVGNILATTTAVNSFAGVLVAPDGTLGNPAFSFVDDQNNGIYSPANDVFAISTNGIERFRIDDGTGNSMFGTTTAGLSSILTLGSSTAPQITLSAGGGFAQWFQRNANGNFFIGTTTVAGTATTSTSAISINGTTGNVGLGGEATGGKFQIFQTLNTNVGGLAFTNIAQTGSARLWADVNDNARFDAGGTAAGSILLNGAGTGKVAIGTTTANYVLTPYSATIPQLSLSFGAGNPQWTFRNAGGNLYISTTTTAGTATTSTAAFTLNSTGVPSLTIGTTTPMISLQNGSLSLGGGGDSLGNTGSTTISMSKIQIDGMSNTGGRVCAFVVGTTWTVVSGACNP